MTFAMRLSTLTLALLTCGLVASCGADARGACVDYSYDADTGSHGNTCASDISSGRCAQIAGDFHEGKTCEQIGLASSCSPLALFFPDSECI